MRASKKIVISAMAACTVGVSYFFWKGDLMPVPSSRSIAKGGEPKVAAQPGHPSILKPNKDAVIDQGKPSSNNRLVFHLHPERVEAELGIIAGDQDRADLARLLEILRGAESENP